MNFPEQIALDSPLLRAIRKRQLHNRNHLGPCMIIDNPHIFREVIAETKAYFTHKGAEDIVTEMKDDIDAYTARYGVFADRIWREEYLNHTIVTRCAPSSVGFPMSMKSS